MEKNFSCRSIIPILSYVEDKGIDTTWFLKDFAYDVNYLKNPRNWVSREFGAEIFMRCQQTFDDPFIMYHIGKSTWFYHTGSFLAFVRLLCSPALFIKFSPHLISFISKFFYVESELVGPHEAYIYFGYHHKDMARRHGCIYNLGWFAGFFQHVVKTRAWIKEQECICEKEMPGILAMAEKPRELKGMRFGCPRCVYHFRWVEPKMAPYMKEFLNQNEELLSQALFAIENKELSLQQKEAVLQRIEINFELQQNQNYFVKYKLSDRERQIALYVAKGKSNKQISEQLFISIDTVKKHLFNIFQKMGVSSRTELAAKIYQNGLTGADSN